MPSLYIIEVSSISQSVIVVGITSTTDELWRIGVRIPDLLNAIQLKIGEQLFVWLQVVCFIIG